MFLKRHLADYVPLSDDLRLQVLPSVDYLSSCKKHHFGAFIKDQQLLIVWDDEAQNIFKRAEYIEKSLIDMVWKEADPANKKAIQNHSIHGSAVGSEEGTISPADLENAIATEKRPTLLFNPVIVALTLALLTVALGLGWRNLAQEVSIDHKYLRLSLLAITPCQIFVSLFFMQTIIINISQILGPISQLNINSKFYSGKPPRRLKCNGEVLPHVTIQMPVYKEGLYTVIQPTIKSLKAALSTYELQGGSGNIFVNDDGMQLIPDPEAQARREFYEEHNIGWVARPKHTPKPQDGEKLFIRGGKFKKASNMNFALMISNKVEDKLLLVERGENWKEEDERAAYDRCLAQVLEEDGRAWAAGNIRIGDYILLIDSDTRVPIDCLLDAASEMELSPQVGILQYSSGVMNVTDKFFEKGSVRIPYHLVLPLTISSAELRSSLISFTLLSDTQLPTEMWLPLLGIMLFFVGQLYSRFLIQMTMGTRSSGPSVTSLKTLICLYVFKLPAILSGLVHILARISKRASL
jgi:hypothetical protein